MMMMMMMRGLARWLTYIQLHCIGPHMRRVNNAYDKCVYLCQTVI